MIELNLASFLPDIEYLTPEGRWDLLQEWIADDPWRAATVEQWANSTPEEIFPELRAIAAKMAEREYGALASALVRTCQLTDEVRNWISQIQTCYLEREKGDTKHVRKRKKRLTA